MSVTWEQVRGMLLNLADARGEWAGYPLPVDHVKLVMEKRFPLPSLDGARFGNLDPVPEPQPEFKVVNHWFDYRSSREVYILQMYETGRRELVTIPQQSGRRLTYWMNTIGVASQHVWSLEAEAQALEKLSSLLSLHALKCYMLTGSFLETSKRSGVSYMFRKLRPTIALRPSNDGNMRVISVLCLHPLGYYDQTWAGVMTPTDDCIAHLLMMRSDERKFWAKANHHQMWMASAGI